MNRHIVIIAAPTLAFALVCGLDIARETDPWDPVEIALDIAATAILVLLIAAVTWSILRMERLREDQSALQDFLTRRTAAGETWRTERAAEIAAMGDAIAREFQAWQLTPAETDIATLLLKGASMKEIAFARETSEATIRQQAQSLYRKAGLAGRAELSAYFLDSLLDEVQVKAGPRLEAVPSAGTSRGTHRSS